VTKLTDWRPIATAPKDGTNILLFCPNGCDCDDRAEGMFSRIVVGCYRGREYDDNGWWICDVMENDFGYYRGDFSQTAIAIEPTHWMALPGEPKP
jgi:hypothetical protein